MRAYFYLLVASLTLGHAIAQERRSDVIRANSGDVEAVQTRSYGYVSSGEITSGSLRVEGVSHNDGTISVDAKNPRSEVISVVYTNGTQIGVIDGRVLGGDMGGGGSRIGTNTDFRQTTSVSTNFNIR